MQALKGGGGGSSIIPVIKEPTPARHVAVEVSATYEQPLSPNSTARLSSSSNSSPTSPGKEKMSLKVNIFGKGRSNSKDETKKDSESSAVEDLISKQIADIKSRLLPNLLPGEKVEDFMGTRPKGLPLTTEELEHCRKFGESLGLQATGLSNFLDQLKDSDGDLVRVNCKGMFAWPSLHWFMMKNSVPSAERGISLYRKIKSSSKKEGIEKKK
jgi:hypothetical protein